MRPWEHKLFEIQHLFSKNGPVISTPNDFLEWLKHKDILWFVDRCIRTLEVDKSTETDFHKITRIK